MGWRAYRQHAAKLRSTLDSLGAPTATPYSSQKKHETAVPNRNAHVRKTLSKHFASDSREEAYTWLAFDDAHLNAAQRRMGSRLSQLLTAHLGAHRVPDAALIARSPHATRCASRPAC